MSNEKYHYEPGAIHNDHHKEINIGSVSEKALGDILKSFLKDDAEDAEYKEVKEKKASTYSKPVAEAHASPAVHETFADRVKAIICKAATKNGQRIETSARGNAGAYIFNIDDGAFCRAMDEMVSSYGDGLKEMLGGTMNCVQVTKVCSFIGNVVRMHVVNDVDLQTVDMLFAFEDYYDNMQTVQAKLGDKKTSSEQDVIFGTFEGLLRKYKA
jgi:hypothetical protein